MAVRRFWYRTERRRATAPYWSWVVARAVISASTSTALPSLRPEAGTATGVNRPSPAEPTTAPGVAPGVAVRRATAALGPVSGGRIGSGAAASAGGGLASDSPPPPPPVEDRARRTAPDRTGSLAISRWRTASKGTARGTYPGVSTLATLLAMAPSRAARPR